MNSDEIDSSVIRNGQRRSTILKRTEIRSFDINNDWFWEATARRTSSEHIVVFKTFFRDQKPDYRRCWYHRQRIRSYAMISQNTSPLSTICDIRERRFIVNTVRKMSMTSCVRGPDQSRHDWSCSLLHRWSSCLRMMEVMSKSRYSFILKDLSLSYLTVKSTHRGRNHGDLAAAITSTTIMTLLFKHANLLRQLWRIIAQLTSMHHDFEFRSRCKGDG